MFNDRFTRKFPWTLAPVSTWIGDRILLLPLSSIISTMLRLLLDVSICLRPTPEPSLVVQGDCLRAGKPSRYEASQLGRLSLLPSARW